VNKRMNDWETEGQRVARSPPSPVAGTRWSGAEKVARRQSNEDCSQQRHTTARRDLRQERDKMTMITRKKNKLAVQVARIGLPPLRADDGLVELSIQACGAKTRRVIENFPADRIPNVGDEIKSERRVGRIPDAFVVMEVKHLLVPRAKETRRAVLLLVKKAHLHLIRSRVNCLRQWDFKSEEKKEQHLRWCELNEDRRVGYNTIRRNRHASKCN
jgi:hypothetical protein